MQKRSFESQLIDFSMVASPMAYYDIDTILMEQEPLPCWFEQDILSMGFLHPTIDSVNLPAGAKVDVPLWLAAALSQRVCCILLDYCGVLK